MRQVQVLKRFWPGHSMIMVMQSLSGIRLLGMEIYRVLHKSVTQLHDGSALFVTVAKYLSPALHEIDQVGITPDVQLSGQEKFRTLTSSYFKCAHGIILEMVLFIGR